MRSANIKLLPVGFCKKFQLVPLGEENGSVVILCNNPSEKIERIVKKWLNVRNIKWEKFESDEEYYKLIECVQNSQAFPLEVFTFSTHCPRCNSKEIGEIRYGLPGAESLKLAKDNKILLGSCIKLPSSPEVHCFSCQFSWSWKH